MTENKNIYEFTLHVSKPNNEDVEPLLYKNWAAVADGMGGSGCGLHSVDKKYRVSVERILQYILPGFDAKKFAKSPMCADFLEYLTSKEKGAITYLSRIFEPCITDEVNTSARWASRIVITSFLYYVSTTYALDLSDDETRGELNRFINDSLRRFKNNLNLSVGDMLVTLPSTFVTSTYKQAEDGEYIVDTAWAGDSRCYILNADGLRKLSVDDENETGFLTNYFSADHCGVLRTRRYKFKAPFVLICASDGFFDAYTDKSGLLVESLLLKDVFEATSSDDLRARLIERYENNHSDDTSLTFVPVGYGSYEELKQSIAERNARVLELYCQHKKFAEAAKTLELPENRATVSVADRFENKFGEIIKRLIGVYFSGGSDVMLTDWWKAAIEACQQDIVQQLWQKKELSRKELYARIADVIKNASADECFRPDIEADTDIAKTINRYLYFKREYDGKAKLFDENQKKAQALTEERKRLAVEIAEEMRKATMELIPFINSLYENGDLESETQYIERRNLINRLKTLTLLEKSLQYGKKEVDKKDKRHDYYRDLVQKVNGFIDRSAKPDKTDTEEQSRIAGIKNALEQTFAELKGYIEPIVRLSGKFFTEAFIAEMKIDAIMAEEIDQSDIAPAVTNAMLAKYQRDSEAIANALNEYRLHFREESCIDSIFLQSALERFRNYYKYREMADDEGLKSYKKAISEYEEYCEALLKDSALYPKTGAPSEKEDKGETADVTETAASEKETVSESSEETEEKTDGEEKPDVAAVSETETTDISSETTEMTAETTETTEVPTETTEPTTETTDITVVDKVKERVPAEESTDSSKDSDDAEGDK